MTPKIPKLMDKKQHNGYYSATEALKLLLRSLGAKEFTASYLCKTMASHPDFPSLAAMHYVLSRAGVENVGIELDFDTLKNEIQKPALVHLTDDRGFAVVKKIDDQYVHLACFARDKKMDTEEFRSIFSGNALVVDNDIQQFNLPKQEFATWVLSKIAGIVLPLLVVFTLFLSFLSNPSVIWPELTFFGIYLIGFVLSVLLFIKQLGVKNKLADGICTRASKNVNCNSILTSKGAMLFGIVSWSEVGLIYYSSLLACIAILGYPNIASMLALVSFATLPYIFYSIYYQWRIAKSWCPLCLMVQGLFVVQAGVALAAGQYWPVDTILLLYMALITFICALFFFLLKPVIEKSIKYDFTNTSFNKFKHMPPIEAMILQGNYVDTSDLEKISFFPEQKYIITFIFSFTCGPCIKKIKKLKEIIETYDNVGLELVFCVKDTKAGTDIPIIRYFLDRFCKSPNSLMDELEGYAENYTVRRNELSLYVPDPLLEKETNRIFLNHNEWFIKNNFIGTPIMLLNNHQLPIEYYLDDLEYIISRE